MAKRLALFITLLCASCVSYVPQDFMSASATKSAAPRLGSLANVNWAGDLAGSNLSTQRVAALQGVAISGTPATGNALVATSPTAAAWGVLPDADVAPGTAGQFFITDATPKATFTSLATIDLLHGRITAGGTGTDTKVIIGPYVANETTLSALYLLTNAQTTAVGPVMYSDGSSLYAIPLSATGEFRVSPGGATAMAISGSSLIAGFGGLATTGAPFGIDWSTATTPVLRSGTSATSLTLGTNKAGATLALQADAAANVMQLAGGTQNGVALGANLATAGHERYPSGVNILVRNPTNSGNNTLFSDDGSNNATIGSGYGTISFNANNFTVVAGGNIILEGGSDFYEDMATLHIRNAAHTETTTILPLSASGAKITGGLAFTTRSITGNLTIDTTTTDKTVIVDTSSGVISVTLPTPTNGREIELIDKKSTWGTNNLTLVRSAAEKIDNVAASRVFSTSGARCKVWSDGTDWYTGC